MLEINDVIHGKITLPSNITEIVKTPQFQRIKYIRQLGFLKPNESLHVVHNRYHHCIGTYYLASKMLDAVERNTEWLSKNNNSIPTVYRTAVQVAALLHDVGHGPFSHGWENKVTNYNHENVGLLCIDEIFKNINEDLFPELHSNDGYGIKLIKILIKGRNEKQEIEIPKQYQFILEIVANKKSNIDVDKWDYLKRDYYYLEDLLHHSSPEATVDFDVVFLKARISNDGQHIEYRYEDYAKIFLLFETRWKFHIYCYRRPRGIISDYVLSLIAAESQATIGEHLLKDVDSRYMSEFLQLTDPNVTKLIEQHPLSECLQATTDYVQVTNDFIKDFKYLSVTDVIPNADVFMSALDDSCFYGEPSNKSNIIDNTKLVINSYKFHYEPSKQIVYYTMEQNQESSSQPQPIVTANRDSAAV